MNNIYKFEEFLNEGTNWTLEMLQAEADKCKTRKEFKYKNKKAYEKACDINILDKLFKNHKNYGYIKNNRGVETYWTKEKLQKEVDNYETKTDFRNSGNRAYGAAKNKKILDDLFKNHTNQGYTNKVKKFENFTKNIN